jgi:hypothetical protein
VFQTFTHDWDIEHTPSAPYNSRSNGKAEAAVKAAKKMLRKTVKNREDQYLALLAIRNTPSQGIGRSQAQRLLNRRTRTRLPTTDTLLAPRIVEKEAEIAKIKNQHDRQAFYYNKQAQKLTPLHEGQTVRMKPFTLGNRSWQKATVKQRLDDRSYKVEGPQGNTYRRNRVHLRKTKEPPLQPATYDSILQEENIKTANDKILTTYETDHQQAQDVNDGTDEESSQPWHTVTRSGRVAKRPAYLDDYET